MVLAVSRHAQTDPDMAAMFCLGFSGFTVARNCVVVDDAGRRDPLALWVIIIAESGAGKSATFNPLIEPIRQLGLVASGQVVAADDPAEVGPPGRPWYERLDDDDHVSAQPAFGASWATLEEVATRLRLAQEAAFPGVPVSMIEGDITPEALVERIGSQVLGLLQASPEAEVLTRVAAGGGSAVQALGQLNKMWVGEDIHVARISRATTTARWPILSLVVAPQPAAFEMIRAGQVGRLINETGFLARCLFCVPESTVGRRVPQGEPIPRDVRVRYAENLRAMLASTLPDGTGPTPLRLSEEATQAFHTYFSELEAQIGPEGSLHALRLWATRVRQAAPRIAAILHVANLAHQRPGGVREPVSGDAMERAIEIARWLLDHGRQVWSREEQPGVLEAAVMDQVRRLRRDFTARDVYRAMGRTSGVVTPILNAFVTRGILTLRQDGRTDYYSLPDS
jgi:hypothetical protein